MVLLLLLLKSFITFIVIFFFATKIFLQLVTDCLIFSHHQTRQLRENSLQLFPSTAERK